MPFKSGGTATASISRGVRWSGSTCPAQRRKESESQRELELICMTNLLAATEARVYFKDLQSRFLLVSAGWIAAYAPGRTAKDLIGKTDFDVFSAEHACAATRDQQRVISTGESILGKVELETPPAAGRTPGC